MRNTSAFQPQPNVQTSTTFTTTSYEGSNDDYENNGSTATAGQSFQIQTNAFITGISIYGSRGNLQSGTFKVEIKDTSTTGTVLATTGTLTTSTALSVYGSPAWNDLTLSSGVLLAKDTTYYLVLTTLTGSASDEVRWSTDTTSPSYAYGQYWSGATGTSGKDRNFRIYTTYNTTTKAYYPLNGNSTDFSGNGNHSTDTAITYPQGRFGQAAKFNGSTSKIVNATDLGITGGPITMSAWIKLGAEISSSLYTVMYQFDTGNEVGYKIVYNYNAGTRQLAFWRIRQNQAFTGPTYNVALGTSNFYNVVLTYDGTNVIGFFNGSSIGVVADSGNGTASALPDQFSIGTVESGAEFFNGLIDEVIIESRAWTAKEVETYYRKSVLNYKKGWLAKMLQAFSISETVSLDETITNLRARNFSVAETATLSETITAALGKIFSVSETVSLAETLSTTRSLLFSVAESVGLIELKASITKKISNLQKNTVASVTNVTKNTVASISNTTKNVVSWINKTKS